MPHVSHAPIDTGPALWVIDEIGHLGALACFIIALFFRDAVNAGLVVKRTFAAGLASSVSLLVFIVLETLVSNAFANVLPAKSQTASMVAGVLAALAFKPVEARAQRLFSRIAGTPREAAPDQAALPSP